MKINSALKSGLKKIAVLGIALITLASCMNSAEEPKIQNELNLAELPTYLTGKCFLKGGIQSLKADIPSSIVKGTTAQIQMKLTCKNGNYFDVTKDTKFKVNNTGILEVSKTGLIRAKTLGNTSIIYSYNAGQSVKHEVSVIDSFVTDLSISSPTTKYVAGESVKLQAHATFSDASDSDLDPSVVDWSSSNSNVATVDTAGVLKLHNKGSTTIRASYGDKKATLPVDVFDAKVESITILPKDLVINSFISDDVQISAEANLSNGEKTALNTDSLTCTSSNNNVLKFSDKQKCLLEIVDDTKTGSVEIEVSHNGLVAKKNIAITTDKISALKIEVTNASGLLPNTSREFKIWAVAGKAQIDVTNNLELVSDNEDIVSIKGNSIYTHRAGKAKLSVAFGEGKDARSATQDIVVGNIELLTGNILPIGSSYPITVRTIDEKGVSHDETVRAEISSNNPKILSVSADKRIVAHQRGVVTLRAELRNEGFVEKKVEVIPAVVKSIEIKGLPNTLKVGSNTELQLYANYTDGSSLLINDTASIKWTATPSDIVEINANGVVTPKKVGVAAITAEYNGTYVTNSVNIDQAEIVDIAVEPKILNLVGLIGDNKQVKAKLVYSDGGTEDINNDKLTCISSNVNIAKVTSGCNVVAVNPGSAQISVSYNEYSKEMPVNVVSDKISGLTLNVDTNNFFVGDSRAYTISATVDGKQYDVTNSLIVNSLNPSVISIDSINHKLIAKSEGQSTITIVYDNKTYVNRVITTVAERVISASINLKDGARDVDMMSLMPHKLYSIEISCRTNKDRSLFGSECGLNLVLKSGGANLNGNQLEALLAGALIIHDNTLSKDFNANITATRNPEYETNAGSFSGLFTKLIISDEHADNNFSISSVDGDRTRAELAKQGRYGVYLSYDKKQKDGTFIRWLDIFVTSTNRSVPIVYTVIDSYAGITGCTPEYGGFWYDNRNNRFSAAPFASNADTSTWYLSVCDKSLSHWSVWHGGDAVRIKK